MSDLAGKYARLEFERRFLVITYPTRLPKARGWRITDRWGT